MSPSYHHSYICGNLIAAFRRLGGYSVFSELTLQIQGKDYIPDVSLYAKRKINLMQEDIIKMTEMPLLICEVISPTQGTQDVLSKFPAYFGAGIISCWMVVPLLASVIVYSAPDAAIAFKTDDVVDAALNIRLSLQEIFE